MLCGMSRMPFMYESFILDKVETKGLRTYDPKQAWKLLFSYPSDVCPIACQFPSDIFSVRGKIFCQTNSWVFLSDILTIFGHAASQIGHTQYPTVIFTPAQFVKKRQVTPIRSSDPFKYLTLFTNSIYLSLFCLCITLCGRLWLADLTSMNAVRVFILEDELLIEKSRNVSLQTSLFRLRDFFPRLNVSHKVLFSIKCCFCIPLGQIFCLVTF